MPRTEARAPSVHLSYAGPSQAVPCLCCGPTERTSNLGASFQHLPSTAQPSPQTKRGWLAGWELARVPPLPLCAPPGTIIKRRLQQTRPERSLFLLSTSAACRALIPNSVSIISAILDTKRLLFVIAREEAGRERKDRWLKPGTPASPA